MPGLPDIADGTLGAGGVLRLSANYGLGPGSGPMDILVCGLNKDGPALAVASGHKAGLVFAMLPGPARGTGRSLCARRLPADRERHLCVTALDAPAPPVDARVPRPDARSLPEPN